MTDSVALREWIKSKGLKLAAIAQKLGITTFTLQKKINNITEFKVSEIVVFTDDLGMSYADRDAIFLRRKVN